MKKTRIRHLYHIVKPSARPIFMSLGSLFFTIGLVFYMYRLKALFFSGDLCILGLLIMLITATRWFLEIINESTFQGCHTIVVQRGIKYGFIFFIISEIMLFFGFFWAFFHSAINPSHYLGCQFPPAGLTPINPFKIPLFNTFLLIVSGISLTWAHKGMKIYNSSYEIIDALYITIFLGFFFLILQLKEYYDADFNFNDSVYACTFYMLTGLHGFHVFIGVIFLSVCLIRYLLGHFTRRHHVGFELAIWYWHFVDVVWIFLFFTVYLWGSW